MRIAGGLLLSFLGFFSVFILGRLAALLAQLPGGLGVFEAVMVATLAPTLAALHPPYSPFVRLCPFTVLDKTVSLCFQPIFTSPPVGSEQSQQEAAMAASPRWRHAAGIVLILHGLAHSLPGMRVSWQFLWVPSVLWAMALAGFLAAGLGLLGVGVMRTRWRLSAAIGVAGSASLLGLGWPTPLALPGLAIDLAVLGLLLAPQHLSIEAKTPSPGADAVAILVVVLAAALVLTRPWHMRWGSTDEELQATLPGDELTPSPRYFTQHAVTIDAPPDSVWPWLVQVGQDRGGFYSYAWLENLFGLRLHNADRIHPEWQRIAAGDSVYATPPGWLGFDRRFGWRVAQAEPGRVLFLENWGAFVLVPNGEKRTRLIVRTRGGRPDRLQDVFLAPLGLVLFEPAHFIMERQMLLRIKQLAAGAA
jgi:hypothetical protein